jgi:hypothetical protein
VHDVPELLHLANTVAILKKKRNFQTHDVKRILVVIIRYFTLKVTLIGTAAQIAGCDVHMTLL